MTNVVQLKNSAKEENIAECIAKIREHLANIEKDPSKCECISFGVDYDRHYTHTFFGGYEFIIGLLEYMKTTKIFSTFYREI